MKHLVNHTTNEYMYGTPMHAHAHTDRVNKKRAHARLTRIAKMQRDLVAKLAELKNMTTSSASR